ncbi:MAG: FtsX-like permease family protein [Cyclobacteriaceae bacterium]|nr:FtsX-like permease family protein [Cyclobacteriaceae bacterium]
MLKNYFTIAFRTLIKFKGYSTINLIGLALGLTTGIFILMFILDELSFDKFHTKADRIYRVSTEMADIKTGEITGKLDANGWPVGSLLKKDYPEVEAMVYIRNGSGLEVIHEGKRFDQKLYYVSEDFFNVFTFPFKEGNPATALSQPNSVVITESMERKFFGDQQALGKTMTFADTLSFVVSGVMKDVPSQSHMQFDILSSFATYTTRINREFSFSEGWGNLNIRNYVLLAEGADHTSFISKSRNLYMDYVKADMERFGRYMYVTFDPMKDIYLKTKNGMGPTGSLTRVYMVSGIAVFVILLACINFINLSTARSAYRAKEVGLRKVVGSSRWALIRQFLAESLSLTMLSFFLALVLVGLLLPFFNQLVGKSYSVSILLQPVLILCFILLIATVSLLAGYYPALVISAIRPTEILKGKMFSNPKGSQLRRVLVVFQFMISATMIICTLLVQDQIRYMKNRDLGFQGDQVLVLNVSKAPADRISPEALKNELKSIPSVDHVTFTNALPGRPGWVGQWAHASEKSADETISVEYMTIDEDYLNTLGLTLVSGHNFDLSRTAELSEGLIINEKTVEMMGWENPENAIGKKIASPSGTPSGTVIGVVKNYHEFGLQSDIYPMTMAYNPQYSRCYAVKFTTENTTELISSLQALWKKHYDGYEFQYFFLDENFEKQYGAEQKLTTVFTVFSVITIIVAIIGLVGLVSFMIVSRTKEIGIRKVLGANVISVTRMLSSEFLMLVLIAIIIACPISYYLASKWLQGFAFRAPINTSIFFITLFAGLFLTLLVVSMQTIKAAFSNPVKSLRNE